METTSTASHAGQIVVGIDGSEHAVAAAIWAAEEGVRHHVPVRLVQSYYQPYLYYPPFAGSTTVNDELLAQAHRELAAAAVAVRAAHPDVELHTTMSFGQPVGTLVDESATARMLVLGARGRHGFDELLLGSTAVAVAAHARCPVAVIRTAGTDRSAPVVVGVDGSPVSDAAVAAAFDEASTRGTGLVAVHAWDASSDGHAHTTVAVIEQLERIEDEERRLLAERLAGWQEKYPDVPVQRVLARQRPAPALLEHAVGAQLVVVGSHGRGGFAGMLLGSTSQAVLHHASCPVMVVRATHT